MILVCNFYQLKLIQYSILYAYRGEVDLDLGNYERFLNIRLTNMHNITTGKIYNRVIS